MRKVLIIVFIIAMVQISYAEENKTVVMSQEELDTIANLVFIFGAKVGAVCGAEACKNLNAKMKAQIKRGYKISPAQQEKLADVTTNEIDKCIEAHMKGKATQEILKGYGYWRKEKGKK